MTRPVRQSLRVPAEFLGTLELVGPEGAGLAYGIRVTDVSADGIGISLRGELPIGAGVRLSFDSGTLSGTVVHCRAEGGHHAAGVKIPADAIALSRIRWAAAMRLHDSLASPYRHHLRG